MGRRETPDMLAGVSQETDDVALAMGGAGRPLVAGSTIHLVRLGQVLANPYQTRLDEDVQHVCGLARSIRAEAATLPDTLGLQQVPMGRLVWQFSNGKIEAMPAHDYSQPGAVASLLSDGAHVQLAFGHSRFAAFRLLHEGFSRKWPNFADSKKDDLHLRAEFLEGRVEYGRIPLRIVFLGDTAMWEQAVRENHDRKDLTPLEEARAIGTAIRELGLTTEQAGKAFGYERSTTANKLRLLNLPQPALDMMQAGWMTERHGRELLRLAPAPHLQAAVIADLVALRQGRSGQEVGTVASLASTVTRMIEGQRAMPVEEIKAARAGFSMEQTYMPPAWPLDWTSASPDVIGPCHGCQYRVIFGIETFPRCTKSQCYQAKQRIWSEKEKERQRAAALAAVEAARPDKPVHVERVIDRIVPVNSSINPFGSPSAPAALLEHGLCGQQQCDCFCLARLDEWRRREKDRYVRPDAANAPDIVYACNSAHNLAARKRRLAAILEPEETQAENQRRAALAAQTKQSKDILRQFYAEIGAAGLASSATVMAKLLTRNSTTRAKEAVAEIWEQIFWLVAESSGMVSESRDYERIYRWDLASTQSWIQKVRSEIVGAIPQPGPGDSQRTGWEDGWEDDDEGMYLMLKAYPKPLTAEDIERIYQPREALRMIEECGDKAARALLWRRYNEIASKEMDHA